MSQTLTNPVKERLAAGQPALGINVRTCRSADIARIAKTSGHDFLFIDTQHSVFDLETIIHIAQTALAIGIAPVVRVRSVDDPDVSLLLDNGVTGIVFPDVSTAEQARRAVQTVRFPPTGRRSVGGGYLQFDFRPIPVGEATRQLNDSTLLVCMIETVEGLENVEEIAKVPGIDVLHVGTNDLLVTMGKAGKFDDPAAVEAQDRVIAAARANGIHAGCGGNRDTTRQAAAVRRGALFLTTQSDVALLTSAATAWAKGVRDALAAGG
ncbi:HpcH/HpaI aldolase family protein [Muricoccus radiodurans]|uniref:HpcH/HpaI aldolase family protein n=1 Tax=Muricoccus radiodurans TaxID=2231721 RepID=UPI003CE977A6